MASIRVGGGAAGLIFTIGSMAVFVIGIPALRYMLPASIVLGCGFALLFHFVPHHARRDILHLG